MFRFLFLCLLLIGCSSEYDSLENYWSVKQKGELCRKFITFNLGIYTRGVWCVLGDYQTVGTEIELGTYKVLDDIIYFTPKLGSCTGKHDQHFDRSTYEMSYTLSEGTLLLSNEDWYSKGGEPKHTVEYGCYLPDSEFFAPNPISTYSKL